jgi:hypothetical protein
LVTVHTCPAASLRTGARNANDVVPGLIATPTAPAARNRLRGLRLVAARDAQFPLLTAIPASSLSNHIRVVADRGPIGRPPDVVAAACTTGQIKKILHLFRRHVAASTELARRCPRRALGALR